MNKEIEKLVEFIYERQIASLKVIDEIKEKGTQTSDDSILYNEEHAILDTYFLVNKEIVKILNEVKNA